MKIQIEIDEDCYEDLIEELVVDGYSPKDFGLYCKNYRSSGFNKQIEKWKQALLKSEVKECKSCKYFSDLKCIKTTPENVIEKNCCNLFERKEVK